MDQHQNNMQQAQIAEDANRNVDIHELEAAARNVIDLIIIYIIGLVIRDSILLVFYYRDLRNVDASAYHGMYLFIPASWMLKE